MVNVTSYLKVEAEICSHHRLFKDQAPADEIWIKFLIRLRYVFYVVVQISSAPTNICSYQGSCDVLVYTKFHWYQISLL